jgi:hypothetical protein
MTTHHPAREDADRVRYVAARSASDGTTSEMLENVVVGVDGDDPGRDALKLAAELISGGGHVWRSVCDPGRGTSIPAFSR